MRILTLEAGEIIMTKSAFLDGKETGSLHGMRESVLGGLATPTDRFETEPGW